MNRRSLTCALVLLVSLQVFTSQAAPTGVKQLIDMSEDELMAKFSQFVSEDKEIASMMERFRVEGHSLQKRQSEDDMRRELDGMDDMDVTPKQEGFMDRAAKFVLELVQRFLKWINTE
ncbi:PREDICTED: uncharacterized protein LOC108556665 [Nicrophorus vespilloides]|uniref:Uncharacterized protein LOC108556665 n=1 Tax=Nicrophorus vespilloides TaxID=110193 RepID=A0ABM1M1A6_NICVS|nr:PREDICTED: uncharacterized protein LOC108556665 [Nicrophorus vespilloides]